MTAHDLMVVLPSCVGIALAVWLVAGLGFHPFAGLLCAALVIGLSTGNAPAEVVHAIEKGFGDILGGTGLVVTLGLGLGAILQLSGAAQTIAARLLGWTGWRHAEWGGLLAALLLGLPLFFETGVVLVLPIIAAGFAGRTSPSGLPLRTMLSALAGLSVLHAMLPPHPGPLIAIQQLHASTGRTMLLGLIVAIPTALIAGPLLARVTAVWIRPEGDLLASEPIDHSAPLWRGVLVLLFPIVLIASGTLARLWAPSPTGALASLISLSDPVPALLIANLLGFALLFERGLVDRGVQERVWREALKPAANILLSIGAGGALKQVMILAGLADVFTRIAALDMLSPLIVAWATAAAIRLATGSATVATITASGVMTQVALHHGVDTGLLVIAIGAGSVFFSHVNDPGFWLVKTYLRISTRDTFRTWSTLETAVSLVGLVGVLALQKLMSIV